MDISVIGDYLNSSYMCPHVYTNTLDLQGMYRQQSLISRTGTVKDNAKQVQTGIMSSLNLRNF